MECKIGNSVNKRISCLSLLALAILTQMLFIFDLPLPGLVLFLSGLVLVLLSILKIEAFPSVPGIPFQLVTPAVLWLMTIFLRMNRIDVIHPIHDLSARFMVATLRISHGNPIFPFISRFEYDEVLISWIFAPAITFFGSSWLSFKIVSIMISTLTVPAAYLLVSKFLNHHAALISAACLMLSGYFQYSDPLIDMSRFSLVTLTLLMTLMITDNALMKDESVHWIWVTALLLAFAIYLHGSGRIVPVIFGINAIILVMRNAKEHRRSSLFRLLLIVTIVLVITLPFVVMVAENQQYIELKKRQIFGIHESFPFSWKGLLENAATVFGSFNYRARLHMLFSDRYPLMHPFMGIGAIGGIWLLIRNISRGWMRGLLLAFVLTSLPLIALTPGHWRGLYFSPPVALLHVIAGIFFYWCMITLIPDAFCKKPGILSVFTVLFVLIMAGVHIPWIWFGPVAPQKIDRITKLYGELENEPDVPHYFSSSLKELKPGYAIFELLGEIRFTDAAVIDFEHFKLTFSDGTDHDFQSFLEEVPELRLIVDRGDEPYLHLLSRADRELTLSNLPDSGLILVVIRNES